MLTKFLGGLVIILPVLVAIVFPWIPAKQESPAMHKAWRWTLLLVAVLYSGMVFWWQIAMEGAASLQQDTAIKKTTDQVHADVKAEDQKVIEQLGSSIGNLSNALASAQQQISDIHESNIVTGRSPIKVTFEGKAGQSANDETKPNIHVSSLPLQADPKHGKFAMQFILTTSQIMEGAYAQVVCRQKINQGSAHLAGVSVEMGGSGLDDDHTFTSRINAPNWSPSRPLVIILYSDEPLSGCSIKLPV